MTDPVLIIRTDGPVTWLTLNRPATMNAIDLDLAIALGDAAEAAAANEGIRVVVLTGSGRMFCAGGDLRHIAQVQTDHPDRLGLIVDNLHRGLLAFARMDPILIVAANGASGAGMSMVAGADYAIASDNAKFAAAYTAAGLSPDGGMSWHLPRHLGVRRARTLMLSNRALLASEALELGLVDEVVPGDQLIAAAETAALSFSSGARGAYAAVKRLTEGELTSYEAHLKKERDSILERFASAEGREGLAAFGERRPPRF